MSWTSKFASNRADTPRTICPHPRLGIEASPMFRLDCRWDFRAPSTQLFCRPKYSTCGLSSGIADWRLDMGGEGSLGDRDDVSRRGEPLLELGGVSRVPPRRT
ncbi:hypothetical protein ARAM_000732 [Aspergillus rambellii]|uniref:Uncharacterized protein n=1 Tax=Aspergillus rambellii TaxID=308745 RepID=A0A0F8WDV1_9EURO|nr:hypothetical protein ARAM_000732 [Aspergillus rambellii]